MRNFSICGKDPKFWVFRKPRFYCRVFFTTQLSEIYPINNNRKKMADAIRPRCRRGHIALLYDIHPRANSFNNMLSARTLKF